MYSYLKNIIKDNLTCNISKETLYKLQKFGTASFETDAEFWDRL